MAWTPDRVPDLSGRTAVVTGGNSGLGLETAAVLAAHGARTLLACRAPSRAHAAAEEIRRRSAGADVETAQLDLADLDSVRRFADRLLETGTRLDLLVNNAGLMAVDEERTAQGFEMQFGVNHLGHYALTAHLMPLLLATPGSRVGTMSSMGHRAARGAWDPRLERPYRRWQAYFQSKLANLLFTAELHRRLTTAAAGTRAVTAHPGGSRTDLGTEGGSMLNRAVTLAVPAVAQSAAVGAHPMLRALTDPDAAGGEFYGPRFITRGSAVRETPSRAARDPQTARRLWELSAELTGVEPSFATTGPADRPVTR